MPIYEYECDGCHQVFEVRQKWSDPAPTQHSCGSDQVRRILSATTFVLKGTGWYKTDYADKKPNDNQGRKEAGESGRSGDAKESGASKEGTSDKKSSSGESSEPKKVAPAKGPDKAS